MAKEASFDIVSEFDRQELVNAIDQTKREMLSRFDLKDSGSEIELDSDKSITFTSSDDLKLRNILDILYSKMSKRGISIKLLDPQKIEHALGGKVKQEFLLRKGLSQDLAKKLVADIKASKLKVQAAIQGDQVRVTAKSIDDLQSVMKILKDKQDDYEAPLQFTNYR